MRPNLADMGAEVIKIENPDGGDDTPRAPARAAGGESHFFMTYDRAKRAWRSTSPSPGTGGGAKLLETADVLVQNFRPGC